MMFPISLEQKIMDMTVPRLQTVEMLFNRHNMKFDNRLPITPDMVCGEAVDMVKGVYYSLFTLSDAEKKEFCDRLMASCSTKS